jgi:hypothetical protein
VPPLPDFETTGDLPVGVYQAALPEVLARFAVGSQQRRTMGERLVRIYNLAKGTGHLSRFIVFGSFVSVTPAPNDVDVFLLMADSFDASQLSGEMALLFDHLAAQAHFGVSVFWLRRPGIFGDEEAAIKDWQIKRDGTRRGIVEVV